MPDACSPRCLMMMLLLLLLLLPFVWLTAQLPRIRANGDDLWPRKSQELWLLCDHNVGFNRHICHRFFCAVLHCVSVVSCDVAARLPHGDNPWHCCSCNSNASESSWKWFVYESRCYRFALGVASSEAWEARGVPIDCLMFIFYLVAVGVVGILIVINVSVVA